jgi:hypothetical protein
MRLRILLPKVNPEAIAVPSTCPYAGCGGRKFHVRQQVSKCHFSKFMALFNHITWRRLANNWLEKPAKAIFEKNRRNHKVAQHLSSSMFASIGNGTMTRFLTIIWRIPVGNRF